MADKDITNQQLLDAMTDQLGVITDTMVTKDDLKAELKNFVTKDDLKAELKNFVTKDDLKTELRKQGVLIESLDHGLKEQSILIESLDHGLREQSILIESLDHEFKAVAELISDNLKVKGRVDDHETRVGKLEDDTRVLKPTVALHSKQMKGLLRRQ